VTIEQIRYVQLVREKKNLQGKFFQQLSEIKN
jgi:hypothetical protein